MNKAMWADNVAVIVPRAVAAAVGRRWAEPMIRPIETSLPSFISRRAGIFSEKAVECQGHRQHVSTTRAHLLISSWDD